MHTRYLLNVCPNTIQVEKAGDIIRVAAMQE